jgi:hypothetical protein
MSLHELKLKFLGCLNGLTSVQIHPLIPLHVNLKLINDVDALKETTNLVEKLYSALEDLYLTGEYAYPILSNHINELIPEVERNKEKITIYLNNYKISHDETVTKLFVVDTVKLQKVKPIGYDKFEDPDFEITFRYTMFESLHKQLDIFLKNLKFLKNQIERKTQLKTKTISRPFEIPDLKEIFRDEKYFEFIIQKTRGRFQDFDSTTGHYKWLKGDEYLAAFAVRLREKNRLLNTNEIQNNQFLRKVFCKFFLIEISNKTFQPNRINEKKKREFSFIVESDT